MKQIILTKGFVAWVDDEDYDDLARFRWHVSHSGWSFYAVRNLPKDSPGRRREYMHRRIAGEPGLLVDHFTHDLQRTQKVIDNRRSNLRLASCGDNIHNSRKYLRATSSLFKGVMLKKTTGRWKATIAGRHLGYFRDEACAAYIVDINAVALYGEFALTNFQVEGSKQWLYG